MVTITGTYEGDLHLRARHEPSAVELTTDAPKDNEGLGRSFSPTDLCATSLMACMATIMGIVAKKEGVNLKGMHLRVDKFMSDSPPRRIVALPVQIWVPAHPSNEVCKKLEQAARNCPVAKSLNSNIEITLEVTWGADHKA